MEKNSSYLLEFLSLISSYLFGIAVIPAVDDLQLQPSSHVGGWYLAQLVTVLSWLLEVVTHHILTQSKLWEAV